VVKAAFSRVLEYIAFYNLFRQVSTAVDEGGVQ
jgi:hypothetical protein